MARDYRLGDKVKLKAPTCDLPTSRGVIAGIDSDLLTVRMDGTVVMVSVAIDAVTNFSLAARKAWRHMPKRNVGRPKGSKVSDRVSVTIRIDRALWERFRKAETEGAIADRTATLNGWIEEHLRVLDTNARKAS